MRLHWVTVGLLAMVGCSDDEAACGGTASCAFANTEWSAKACDCVPVPASQADLWTYFTGDYDWVEFHATLKAAVASSDVTMLGKVKAVSKGTLIQGDAAEDVYEEIDLTIESIETLRGDVPPTQSVTLTLPVNQRLSDDLVAYMNGALPASPVFVILRERESGKYRVVNGYGLWTKWLRGPIDAPLVARGDLEFVAAETAGKQNVEQLANALR